MVVTANSAPDTTCRWCGLLHGPRCPAVKSMSFHDNGTVAHVEFNELSALQTVIPEASPEAPQIVQPKFVVYGPVKLRTDDSINVWYKDVPIQFTVTEYKILAHLIRYAGQIKSRDSLITAGLGDDIHVFERTMDSHIKRIRHKFWEVDPHFDLIETVYGMGYRVRLLDEVPRPSAVHRRA